MSEAKGGEGGLGVRKILTMAENGARGVRQMLTLADQAGRYDLFGNI